MSPPASASGCRGRGETPIRKLLNDRVQIERDADPRRVACIEADGMREPSREQHALAVLGGEADVLTRIMQFGKGIAEKWCQHGREASAGVIEVQIPAEAAACRDIADVHILDPRPEEAGVRKSGVP